MSEIVDIRNHLITQGIVEGATGWDCTIGYTRTSADQTVVIQHDFGDLPTKELFFRNFYIRVRAAPYAYDVCETKLLQIMNTLDDATIASLVYIFADSDIINIGTDENNRPLLGVNFKTCIQRI